jgi:hypothetical protein
MFTSSFAGNSDSTHMQFIPIVEYKTFEKSAPQTWDPLTLPKDGTPEARPGHPHSIVTDWSVDPYDYGDFLIGVFNEWYRKDVGTVLVNHFESLVAQHLGMPSQLCIYGEICGKGLAIEHDGERLRLRSLRLPGIQNREYSGPPVSGHRVFQKPGQIWLRQVRHPALLLPEVRLSEGLLGRMSQEQNHSNRRRRARAKLFMPGA